MCSAQFGETLCFNVPGSHNERALSFSCVCVHLRIYWWKNLDALKVNVHSLETTDGYISVQRHNEQNSMKYGDVFVNCGCFSVPDF